MSVKNVKVVNIRKDGFDNLREWMNSPENIYIGRAGIVFIDNERYPKESSPYCNPYKIGKDGTRDEVILKYKNYLISKIENSNEFKKNFLKLKNKNLGCWCHPEKCHGDVILELLDIYI